MNTDLPHPATVPLKFAVLIEPEAHVRSDSELYACVRAHGKAVIMPVDKNWKSLTRIVLTPAAFQKEWCGDDGRLTEALAKCQFNEVEMFPKGRLITGRAVIVDTVEISTFPTSQK